MLLVLSLSLALFFGGVADASAAEGFSISGGIVDEPHATLGPLKASLMDAKSRSYLREWQTDSSNWIIFVTSRSLVFVRLPVPVTAYFAFNGSGLSLLKSCPIIQLVFDLDSGEPAVYSGTNYLSKSWTTSTGLPKDFIQYKYFSPLGVTSDNINVWKPVKESPAGAFTVLLDDEEPPTPSEPDPPTPSEPDPPPPVSYPDFPVVGPADNQYIPYDVTVWNQFADHIKKTLGALVPVCLICLSIILGIRVVVKLVNHFAK